MSDRLMVAGEWPGTLTITKGWSRAEARPWNDDEGPGHLRLRRGSPDFLRQATDLVGSHSGGLVYSPALYPDSTRVWRRAGYRRFDHLMIMERSLIDPWPPSDAMVEEVDNPDWDRLAGVDSSAFDGFWRMSPAGLREAAEVTKRSTVFVASVDGGPVGFVVVGSQLGNGYLQRLAVRPENAGKGLGTALVRAALSWARGTGARVMVLNVRVESAAALSLYRAEGFTDTGVKLELLSHRD